MRLHTQPNPFTAHIDFDDTDTDVLMEADDLHGGGDEAVGELGDVDKTVLMDTDVDESTEVGDVRHDASEFHSYDEVVEGVDILVELEDFNLSTWVTSRLLKLGEDVTEGCLTPSPLQPPPAPQKRGEPYLRSVRYCSYARFLCCMSIHFQI